MWICPYFCYQLSFCHKNELQSVQSDVCVLEQVRYLARMSSEHLLDIVF